MPQSRERSRARLKEAFVQLLAQQELDTLTVADLVQTAEVSRSTFYRNFLGLPDFLDWVQTDLINEISDRFKTNSGQGPDFYRFYTYLTANRQIILAFFAGTRWPAFISALYAAGADHYTTALRDQDTGLPTAVVNAWLMGGHINLFQWWLQQDDPPTPAVMANYHQQLANGTLHP